MINYHHGLLILSYLLQFSAELSGWDRGRCQCEVILQPKKTFDVPLTPQTHDSPSLSKGLHFFLKKNDDNDL